MKRALLLLAALSFTACEADSGDDGFGQTEQAIRLPTPRTCLPTCAGSRDYDALSYLLKARFDWDARRLHALELVSLRLSAARVVELDAEVEVSSVSGLFGPLAFVQEGNKLRVDLTPVAWLPLPPTFAVEYQASPSDSLLAKGARDDDPVPARVVFTDSEPDRGLRWLVAKHDPSDRAIFGVEVKVGKDEDVIANGRRVLDLRGRNTRVVGYLMEDPIPTYLMAFAAGELVHTDGMAGAVPLSVWHRRGLAVDAQANLAVMAEAMAIFEARLGPYPFERYSVVLLPDFGGGMENATITFNSEISGQGTPSAGLHAHELGHHWFGDWVTMPTYDDVWVKEGMATLLASEALRAPRDAEGAGRLGGRDFAFSAFDAIVDPTLTGLAKYTSGPYERAAWTITQIRVLVGEDAFWATLRRVLDEHALGGIDGESFVRAFPLDEATADRIVAALPKVDVPIFDFSAAGTDFTLTMTDPGDVLFAPIDVTVVDADGAATVHRLEKDVPLTVSVPPGGYLAPDEADRHPDWGNSFEMDFDTFFSTIASAFVPTAPAALEAFGHRSAAHQETALNWGAYALEPDAFPTFYGALDTTFARFSAMVVGCNQIAFDPDPARQAAWRTSLTPVVQSPPLQLFSLGFGRCGVPLATQVLGSELAALATATTPAALTRLEYLIAFDYGPTTSLAVIGELERTAPSVRLRDRAMSRLQAQTAGTRYSRIPVAELEAWRAFFRERLPFTTSAGRFSTMANAILALNDQPTFPALAPLMRPASESVQRSVVCRVFALTGGNTTWTAFQDAAQPWATLAPAAAARVADPSLCP